MIELILHPGHPKCGSTAIQQSLLRNRKALSNQGVYFPDNQFLFPFENNQCNLKAESPRPFFRKIHESNDLNGIAERLDLVKLSALKSNCKKIIISAENLINKINKGVGKELHAIFAEKFDNVRVIYYVRKQDDYLLSAWQQWNHKVGESFDEYSNKSLKKMTPNYLYLANFFSETYGNENLIVVPFKSNLLLGGNLIEDFYTRSGLEISNLNLKSIKNNQALNPYICDILSKNSFVYENVHDGKVKGILEKNVKNKSILFEKSKSYLSPQRRQRIMQHFFAANTQLHKKYLTGYNFNDIFANSVSKTTDNSKEKETYLEQLNQELLLQLVDNAITNR